MGMHSPLHTTYHSIMYLETESDTSQYTTLVWQLLKIVKTQRTANAGKEVLSG